MSNFSNRRHGTAERYQKDGCRCEPCKKAYNTYSKVLRAKRTAARGGATPDPLLPHGRVGTYRNWGCRCQRCTDAVRDDAGTRRGSVAVREACPVCGREVSVNPSGTIRKHRVDGVRCNGSVAA